MSEMDAPPANLTLSDSLASSVFSIDSIWMIEPTIGMQLWADLATQDRASHEAAFAASPTMDAAMKYFSSFGSDLDANAAEKSAPPSFADRFPRLMQGDIAVLDVKGPMTKDPVSMGSGTSTAYLRRMVQLASRDDSVAAIVLRVDSPGGAVSGTADLAETIQKAAQVKDVIGFGEDLVASAAYWAFCGCTKLFVTPYTPVGSIGAYTSIPDLSRMAAMKGIDANLVTSTGAEAFKGMGFPGTPVTQAQKDEAKRRIDAMQSHFSGFVARQRGFDDRKMKLVADGRVHPAADALRLGLVDGIASFDTVLGELSNVTRKRPAPRRAQEKSQMADEELEAQQEGLITRALQKMGFVEKPAAAAGQPALMHPALMSAPQAALMSAPQAALLDACTATGVPDVASLHTLTAQAAEGRALRAALVADCNAQAVRALGTDAAKAATAGLDHLPVATIAEKRDAFRAHANEAFGIDGTHGAERKSASAELITPPKAPVVSKPIGYADADAATAEAFVEAGRAAGRAFNGTK